MYARWTSTCARMVLLPRRYGPVHAAWQCNRLAIGTRPRRSSLIPCMAGWAGCTRNARVSTKTRSRHRMRPRRAARTVPEVATCGPAAEPCGPAAEPCAAGLRSSKRGPAQSVRPKMVDAATPSPPCQPSALTAALGRRGRQPGARGGGARAVDAEHRGALKVGTPFRGGGGHVEDKGACAKGVGVAGMRTGTPQVRHTCARRHFASGKRWLELGLPPLLVFTLLRRNVWPPVCCSPVALQGTVKESEKEMAGMNATSRFVLRAGRCVAGPGTTACLAGPASMCANLRPIRHADWALRPHQFGLRVVQ